MIVVAEGDLLQANVEALVNGVNCVGVMGKGIALQFKQVFPGNYAAYHQACRVGGKVVLGRMFVYETGLPVGPKYIINFPTKGHWINKSRIQDIQAGLASLVKEVCCRDIHSIAIPALGCGLGGLCWNHVYALIEGVFRDFAALRVLVFPPRESTNFLEWG